MEKKRNITFKNNVKKNSVNNMVLNKRIKPITRKVSILSPKMAHIYAKIVNNSNTYDEMLNTLEQLPVSTLSNKKRILSNTSLTNKNKRERLNDMNITNFSKDLLREKLQREFGNQKIPNWSWWNSK